MVKIAVKIDKKDMKNIISISELEIKLITRLKKKLEKKSIFCSAEFLMPIVERQLFLNLSTKLGKKKEINIDI